MELLFKRCKHCGNIVAVVKNSGVPIICCGEPMEEIKANTTDGALEKHVPVIISDHNIVTVKVGSLPHPSLKEHHIEWVVLQTKFGNQRKYIGPDSNNEVKFALLENDEVINAFAYCNIHGLFKAR